MARKKSNNRGRDLRRTETQAALDIGRYVTNERGRANGKEKLDVVSGVKPGLRRRKPSEKRSPNLTADDIGRITPRKYFPAEVHSTKDGRVKMVRYFVDPTTLER
jgi:hypothetical protein